MLRLFKIIIKKVVWAKAPVSSEFKVSRKRSVIARNPSTFLWINSVTKQSQRRGRFACARGDHPFLSAPIFDRIGIMGETKHVSRKGSDYT